MIPAILHFVVPAVPSARQLEIVEVARRLHPNWTVHVWHDRHEIADGRLCHYLQRCRNGAQRADLIRLDAIDTIGGIYLDSDVHLRRPLDFLLGMDTFIVASEDGQRASNAFFAGPPRHAATRALIRRLLEYEPDWTRPPNETTGPELFSSVLRYRMDVQVLPRQSFYPYNWNERLPGAFPPTVCGIHEWSRSWHPPDAVRPCSTATRKITASAQAVARPLLAIIRRLLAAALPPEITRLAEQHGRPSYAMGRDIVTSTRHGVKMVLPGSDLSLTPALALNGEFERDEEKFVLSIVRGGDWIIDVGANVGLYALLAASRCGPFGRVFALEPNDETAKYLRKSVLMNWYQDRVRILAVAASDTKGERTLTGTPSRLGDFRLDETASSGGAAKLTHTIAEGFIELNICTTRLDELFAFDVPIKLLKIDAEGHDAHVLRGARRLIESRAIQYIMIEVSQDSAEGGIAELIAALRDVVAAGYRAHLPGNNGRLRPIANFEHHIPSTGHVNMIFAADWDDGGSPHRG